MNETMLDVLLALVAWATIGIIGLAHATKDKGSDPPRRAWLAAAILGPLVVTLLAWVGRRRKKSQARLEDFS
jgi:hypothetical protein